MYGGRCKQNVNFLFTVASDSPAPLLPRQIRLEDNVSIFTKLRICSEYSQLNDLPCLSDLARAPGPGRHDYSARLRDSASDPARRLGATTTRRVSVTQPGLQGPDTVNSRHISVTPPATPLEHLPWRPSLLYQVGPLCKGVTPVVIFCVVAWCLRRVFLLFRSCSSEIIQIPK